MGLFNRNQYVIRFDSNAKRIKKVEYMCTYCGHKETRKEGMGRPMPGRCPRREGNKPHRWVINRKY